jgi:hypothetical protein
MTNEAAILQLLKQIDEQIDESLALLHRLQSTKRAALNLLEQLRVETATDADADPEVHQ